MTFRMSDSKGRQIVQVRFYGQQTKRTYTYAVDPDVGELKEKDWVWTPGNGVNPFGTLAGVVKIGSEYDGKMSVITQKVDKGYGPQVITVARFDNRPTMERLAEESAKIRAEEYGDR